MHPEEGISWQSALGVRLLPSMKGHQKPGNQTEGFLRRRAQVVSLTFDNPVKVRNHLPPVARSDREYILSSALFAGFRILGQEFRVNGRPVVPEKTESSLHKKGAAGVRSEVVLKGKIDMLAIPVDFTVRDPLERG
jgi:hypothetical protein